MYMKWQTPQLYTSKCWIAYVVGEREEGDKVIQPLRLSYVYSNLLFSLQLARSNALLAHNLFT